MTPPPAHCRMASQGWWIPPNPALKINNNNDGAGASFKSAYRIISVLFAQNPQRLVYHWRFLLSVLC